MAAPMIYRNARTELPANSGRDRHRKAKQRDGRAAVWHGGGHMVFNGDMEIIVLTLRVKSRPVTSLVRWFLNASAQVRVATIFHR